METATLQTIVVYLVAEFGVPGFSVWLLARLDSIKEGWFAKLSYGLKRAAAIALAALIVSFVWAIGLWFGYFDMPGDGLQPWVEAWVAMVAPAAIVQQLIHGAMKTDAATSANA